MWIKNWKTKEILVFPTTPKPKKIIIPRMWWNRRKGGYKRVKYLSEVTPRKKCFICKSYRALHFIEYVWFNLMYKWIVVDRYYKPKCLTCIYDPKSVI